MSGQMYVLCSKFLSINFNQNQSKENLLNSTLKAENVKFCNMQVLRHLVRVDMLILFILLITFLRIKQQICVSYFFNAPNYSNNCLVLNV
jgi:hypothetical protein